MNLPKTYEPNQYEADIYALWDKAGVFAPKHRDNDKNYSIVMPPPNANANLHIGYALTAALQDILTRYHRMRGEATLLLPGADHAGFETQSVYEKKLAKEGKSRFEFSRDDLYKQIWDFVAENRGSFEKQLRAMGVSCDWSRYTFTLDDKITNRAFQTFKKMWDEKLIYRGERLVNYCTFHGTGFADVEVVYEDAKTPLYYMKYGPFELATTRPETKFGDTAVAVNPKDDRYKDWVGKTVTVEGVNGPFDVMVIADDMVDMTFGTGVVKITPAHSFDDWEVATRHNLPAVRVINHDGTMNEKAGRFRGMTILDAREAVVQALKEKGLLVKVDEDYQNRVGKCYKCGTVIEPMLMKQWFVDMQPLAKRAIEALEEGKIKFYPEAKKDQLTNYLMGLRDWNISRQIAWGIPIPAFQNVDDEDDWIYDERVGQEIIEVDGKTYHRDPDVFDTWFSSSSWPYATLDFPDSDDFKDFYPLSLMETGGEILYPWVSRMIMLGLYITDEIPFKDVYIHGYVMAEDGSKMSKSIGNVVDPFPVIEQYGSDALRIGIVTGRSAAVNSGYDSRRVEEARNFCNKLWNIARFIEDKLGADYDHSEKAKPNNTADHWILYKLQHLIKELDASLDSYNFSEAYELLYHFVWDDFASWYIEASKVELNKPLLLDVFESVLKLAHPFAPFLTETIWQTINSNSTTLLAVEKWPVASRLSDKQASEFEQVIAVVSEVRQLTAELNLHDSSLYYQKAPFLENNSELVKKLAKLKNIKTVNDGIGLQLVQVEYQAWLDVDSATIGQYQNQLEAQKAKITTTINSLESRLANKGYVKSAPKAVVDQTKDQLKENQQLLEKITVQQARYVSSS